MHSDVQVCCTETDRHASMEEKNPSNTASLSVVDIAHVLQANYAFISGMFTSVHIDLFIKHLGKVWSLYDLILFVYFDLSHFELCTV